jgi:hypothetical protein
MKTMLALLCMVGGMAMAQSNTRISGVVHDAHGTKLPYANIFLYTAVDSVFQKAVAADAEAHFTMEDVMQGTFFIKVSAVGYKDYFSPRFVLNGDIPHIHLKDIYLTEQATELLGVQVTARKPFIEQHLDKMVLNVENSISSSGSTALEILEKAPGVAVDRQSDQIRIRNKSGVVIMIDGKIVPMTAEALSQYLNNLNSEQIATIEVITNPSSRFDAAGNAGIINIKLKKSQNYGTSGTISTSVGTGMLPRSTSDLSRGSLNANLNHRNEKWFVYGNLSVGRNTFYNDNHFLRSVPNASGRTEFDQYTERIGGGETYRAKLGTDYKLDSKTTVGIQTDIYLWDANMISRGTSIVQAYFDENMELTRLKPGSTRTMGSLVYSTNANFRRTTKKIDMSFDVDYAAYRNRSKEVFKTEYFFITGDSLNRLRVIQPNNIDILSGKIDFTIPFNNTFKLDFGAKSTKVVADNDFTFDDELNGQWVLNIKQSNHFKYEESIQAIYFSSAYNIKKWSFQVGLRGEFTATDGHSVTMSQRTLREYFNLFPTGYARYKLNENHEIKYAYSKRIDRPNYASLNPYLSYVDPYFYAKGNPFLEPQFTANNELTYSYKNLYTAILGFSDTRQLINEVMYREGNVNISQMQNLARRRNWSLLFSIPWKLTPKWESHNTFSFFQNRFTDQDLGGYAIDNIAFTAGLNTTQVLTLPKKWTLELNYWYNTPGVFGVFHQTKAQHSFNPGVQKNLGKWKMKLTMSDVFLTSFFQAYVDYGDMDLRISNRFNSRRLTLALTYNFGNQNIKIQNRKSATEEEKRRAGAS